MFTPFVNDFSISIPLSEFKADKLGSNPIIAIVEVTIIVLIATLETFPVFLIRFKKSILSVA